MTGILDSMSDTTDTDCAHSVVGRTDTIEDGEPIYECRTCKQHFYLRRKSGAWAAPLSELAGPDDDHDLEDI